MANEKFNSDFERANPVVKQVAAEFGISPEIIKAQAAHESGWGEHAPGNNYFGIKATKDWKGKTQTLRTHEEVDGKSVPIMAKFRAYDSLEESVADYGNFIKENPRYASAIKAGKEGGDEAYIREVAKAGYGTDSNYAQKVLTTAKGVPFKEAPVKDAPVNVSGLAPAVVNQPVAVVPQKATPVIAQQPVVNTPVAPVVNTPQENPMEEMQAAEPITPEALQYAQAAVPKQPSLYEMMDAYGAESPVATVTPMGSLQQMAQLQQSQNIRKAAAAAANLGEGLAPVDTRVAGTNEQLAQIQQENRPMATFNNILANQRAEAMNYG